MTGARKRTMERKKKDVPGTVGERDRRASVPTAIVVVVVVIVVAAAAEEETARCQRSGSVCGRQPWLLHTREAGNKQAAKEANKAKHKREGIERERERERGGRGGMKRQTPPPQEIPIRNASEDPPEASLPMMSLTKSPLC
ncbi:hypothetical protein BHE74_00022686 [Ensete ventricosum]|nr:hypothetical protein GW17_00011619 [Ensete ventricosum]RWW69702.1 hypothetical protein BHE74_00022686 [Ensete ventricosum]